MYSGIHRICAKSSSIFNRSVKMADQAFQSLDNYSHINDSILIQFNGFFFSYLTMQCQSQHIPGKSQHCHFDEQRNLKFTQIKGLILYSVLSSETLYNVK